jgi:hypothetical protein
MSAIITGGKVVNGERLVAKLVQAFEDWAEEDITNAWWDDQFREMGKWNYDGITRRKSGETVGSPRDIYDLGALYESGVNSYNFDASKTVAVASWRWDARNSSGDYYARYVHDGLGTNLTARPWTDELFYPQKFSGSVPERALQNRIKSALTIK